MVAGLVFLVVGVAAVVGCVFLIRNRVALYEATVSQPGDLLGGWLSKVSASGASRIFMVAGVAGILIGAGAIVVAILTMLGIEPPAR